jgi:exosortase/archaeosortase family protein
MGGASDNRGGGGIQAKPVLVFVGAYILFEALLIVAGMSGVLAPYMAFLARTTGSVCNWTGAPNTVEASQIYLANRILLINLDCTGLFVVAVFSALILAYPCSTRHKLLGLLIGIPVLLAVNLTRLIAAAQVAVRWPGSFAFMHDLVFQVGMVLVAVLIWAIWIGGATRGEKPLPDETDPAT